MVPEILILPEILLENLKLHTRADATAKNMHTGLSQRHIMHGHIYYAYLPAGNPIGTQNL